MEAFYMRRLEKDLAADSSIASIEHIEGIGSAGAGRLPLFTARIAAGFPSPADDYIDRSLDLNEFLVKHPSATFFVRVSGDSMTGAGIHSGDILIVDRAESPRNNSIIIAALNGELTVKRMVREGGALLPVGPIHYPLERNPGGARLTFSGVYLLLELQSAHDVPVSLSRSGIYEIAVKFYEMMEDKSAVLYLRMGDGEAA